MTGRGEHDTETITLWRCSECGKWSRAQRRPKHHERAVYDEPDEGTQVLRVEPDGREVDTGAWLEVFIVACGPFVEYRAERVSS